MKYNELNHPKNRSAKRLGRGISAGQGKTAGRGTKGQKARTGYSKKPGFSGGQNPLMQQLPKLPGFKSHYKKAENVFTDQLESLSSKNIDANLFYEKGLVSSPFVKIKLLKRGELKKSLIVNLPLASKTAIQTIEEAGGSFNKIAVLKREKKIKETKRES